MKQITVTEAAALLSNGHVVAVPTETVYGLAARYNDAAAVQQIFTLKNRPLDHPLILHCESINAITTFGRDIPNYVYTLAQQFSPGPLTYILKKTNIVPDQITAGQDTVAIRIPAHPVIQQLLNELKQPVVAPSANPYCQLSPSSAEHVYHYFGNHVAILDGGRCNVGIESTIIDATDPNRITLLRPGGIHLEQIQQCTGVECISKQASKIHYPGNKKVHYAPKTPLQLLDRATIEGRLKTNTSTHCAYVLISDTTPESKMVTHLPSDPKGYAQLLYHTLHQLDQQNFDCIIIETPPQNSAWQGVNDRLNKASATA